MRLTRQLIQFVSSIVLGTAGAAFAADNGSFVVQPSAVVAGRSQAEWSQRWWTWASSFPRESSPVADRTGKHCAAGQSGPVWFLAGAFGSALVERRCTVPAGRYLFFPLVNSVAFPPPGSSLNCEQAAERAKEMTDSPRVLVAEIDGEQIVDLERHRQVSPQCFDLSNGSDPRLSLFPTAANGYYLMIAPLRPGRHTLRFGGEVQSLRQAITYEIDVQ